MVTDTCTWSARLGVSAPCWAACRTSSAPTARTPSTAITPNLVGTSWPTMNVAAGRCRAPRLPSDRPAPTRARAETDATIVHSARELDPRRCRVGCTIMAVLSSRTRARCSTREVPTSPEALQAARSPRALTHLWELAPFAAPGSGTLWRHPRHRSPPAGTRRRWGARPG